MLKSRIILLLLFFLITGCEKKQNNNDDFSDFQNITFTSIDGFSYNTTEVLSTYDHILFYGFSTWCSWSKLSLAQIKKIDSMYNDCVAVFGVEGSPSPYEVEIDSFILKNMIEFPICYLNDNSELINILYPDKILEFPVILLIDHNDNLLYKQNGYLENSSDSLIKYINHN